AIIQNGRPAQSACAFCFLIYYFLTSSVNFNKYVFNETSRFAQRKISDHQQSWGYEEGPWKGPGYAGGR
ncbi:MAG: hypothetical protein KJP23_09915, partial [Deltaproteobacteria bacterium]|nr:hypothetical protein [Deltaproteobacteria bacterium]